MPCSVVWGLIVEVNADGITGCAWDVADDHPIGFKKPIGERGLTDIGTTYERDTGAELGNVDFFDNWLGAEEFRELVEELIDIEAMFGGDGDMRAETEGMEVIEGLDLVMRVDFVNDEEGWFAIFAKGFGDDFVLSSEAGLSIDDEEDNGGGLDSEVYLVFGSGVDLFGGHGGGLHADAAGVHEDEVVIDFMHTDVASDAWLVVDDGDTFADDTVKEAAFADIGTAYNGYAACWIYHYVITLFIKVIKI